MQLQPLTASSTVTPTKLSRFHRPISSSSAPHDPRSWRTVMLGCSPRPQAAAHSSHKRAGFPSFQTYSVDVSYSLAPPSTQPSLILCPDFTPTTTGGTGSETVSNSMFAAALAAVGSGGQQQGSGSEAARPLPIESLLPVDSAGTWKLDINDATRPWKLDSHDSVRPSKFLRSSSAAAAAPATGSQAAPGGASLGRTLQVRGSAFLLRGQSMSGHASASLPELSEAKHNCPDISNDVMACWGRVAIESYGSGNLASVWQQPRLLL